MIHETRKMEIAYQLPLVAITKLIIKIPDIIVKTMAGLYCLIEGYSSTIEAPKAPMHPITVETDTKMTSELEFEISQVSPIFI